jgi:predicted metalloendopeptidase
VMSLKDFYNSVNRKWLDSHTIPADDVSYSVFDEREEGIRNELYELMNRERKKTSPLGLFIESFYSGRDQDLHVLQEFVQKIMMFKEPEYKIGYLNLYGLDSPISIDISYDQRNTKNYCIYLSPPPLGITKMDLVGNGDIARKYSRYLRDLGRMLEIPDFGEKIFTLERTLAPIYPDPEDSDKSENLYHPYTYSRLRTMFPNIDFDILFAPLQIGQYNGLLILTRVEYFVWLDQFLQSEKAGSSQLIDAWITKYIYSSLMTILPNPYRSLNFDFYNKFISGQKKQFSPEYEILQICDDVAQDTLGKLYVEANFKRCKRIQDGASEIYSLVHSAAQKRISNLKWLSEDTREIAIYKLQKMKSKIAFPNYWLNEFNGVQILPEQFMLNILNLNQKSVLYDIRKLRGETAQERAIWKNSCYEVNAFYYAEQNELCVPLGFLGEPFFSLEQSFVKNLAGVGNVMAHEISHGFDEEGHKYDELGNNFPWWTNLDVELYKTKTRVLIQAFDERQLNGIKINGKLTLGENLADFGAIAICLDVLRIYWKKMGTSEPKQKSDLRDFFTGYARSWAFKNRRAAALQASKSDRHAPPELRVNVVLLHFDEFYSAFGFTQADEGWIPPEERIDIWG